MKWEDQNKEKKIICFVQKNNNITKILFLSHTHAHTPSCTHILMEIINRIELVNTRRNEKIYGSFIYSSHSVVHLFWFICYLEFEMFCNFFSYYSDRRIREKFIFFEILKWHEASTFIRVMNNVHSISLKSLLFSKMNYKPFPNDCLTIFIKRPGNLTHTHTC